MCDPVWVEQGNLCVHLCASKFRFLHPGRLPACLYGRISAEIQLLGLLIPFYCSGIMRYSNLNPIWGVRRWHEDDVTVGTRGKNRRSQAERVTSTLLGDRLLLNDYIGGLWPPPHFLISKEEKNLHHRLSVDISRGGGTCIFFTWVPEHKFYMEGATF